jgi:hypothetical protein
MELREVGLRINWTVDDAFDYSGKYQLPKPFIKERDIDHELLRAAETANLSTGNSTGIKDPYRHSIARRHRCWHFRCREYINDS